jgi:hypothetical protein
MKPGRVWLIVAALLAGVWCTVGMAILFVRAHTPTPEKTMAWVASRPLEGQSAAERMQRIEELARQLNRLKLEDRATVLFALLTSNLYDQMTQPELTRFGELILPPGILPMLKAFDNFSPESRRRYLDRAVSELETRGVRNHGPIRGKLPKDALERIARDGATAYLREAGPKAQLELQPFMEQIQNIVQMAR